MDLYGLNSSLQRTYSEQTTFSTNKNRVGGVPNELTKFASDNILSSSSWSSVIHQPSQDSEPEDLPSTVDIDAIKEPVTPLGPLSTLSTTFTERTIVDESSDSDTDSDSESGNNDENVDSGADSASFSDSGSLSSSSSPDLSRRPSSHSSTSNSSSNNDDSHKKSLVREFNSNKDSPRSKRSTRILKTRKSLQSDSSDSSEPQMNIPKNWSHLTPKIQQRLSLKQRNERSQQKKNLFGVKRCNQNSDSDSSSSSSNSISKPAKSSILKLSSKLDHAVAQTKLGSGMFAGSNFTKLSTDLEKSSVKLLQSCKLSEDSCDSDNSSAANPKNSNIPKRRINADQVPEQKTDCDSSVRIEQHEDLCNTRKTNICSSSLSDSSSESELLPKQLVRDAINSIRLDSESSKDSSDNLITSQAKPDVHQLQTQYSSTVLKSCGDKSDRLDKNDESQKSTSNSTSHKQLNSPSINQRKTRDRTSRKQRSAAHASKSPCPSQTENYVTAKTSPDTGFQSNSPSPSNRKLSNVFLTSGKKSGCRARQRNIFKNHISCKTLDDSVSSKTNPDSNTPSKLKESNVVDDVLKVPPYFVPDGNRDLIADQKEKRGPGRPRKNRLVNDTVTVDPVREKHERGVPKRNSSALELENNQARETTDHNSNKSISKCSSSTFESFIKPDHRSHKSPHPETKYWKSRKVKKHKKKLGHEKQMNPALLREIENLIDNLDKKCVIRSTSASPAKPKTLTRGKERSNKKGKDSYPGSGCETKTTVSVMASNESKMKRRHKKSSSEIPKDTNSDQRLPLKKRHYHVSTSSSTMGANDNQKLNNGESVDSTTKNITKSSLSLKNNEHYKAVAECSKAISKTELSLVIKSEKTVSLESKTKFESTKVQITRQMKCEFRREGEPRSRKMSVKRNDDADVPSKRARNSSVAERKSSRNTKTSSKVAEIKKTCKNATDLEKVGQPRTSRACARVIRPNSNRSPSSVEKFENNAEGGKVTNTSCCSEDAEKFANRNKSSIDKPPVLGDFVTNISDSNFVICVPSNASPKLELPGRRPTAGDEVKSYRKRSTNDVVQKLGVKQEVLKPAGQSNKGLTTEDANVKRVLRPKKSTTEKENVDVDTKGNQLCKVISIRLDKLADSHVLGAKDGVAKVKVKRRKTNKTGFPVLKKKKKKCGTAAPAPTPYVLDKLGKPGTDELDAISTASENAKQTNDNNGNPLNVLCKSTVIETETDCDIVVNEKSDICTETSSVVGSEKKCTKEMTKRHSLRILSNQQQQKTKEETQKKEPVTEVGTESAGCRILRKREPPRHKSNDDANRKCEIVQEKKQKLDVFAEKIDNLNGSDETMMISDVDKDESSDDSKKETCPKNKRKYIVAGLFSNYYKEEKNSNGDLKNRLVTCKLEDHPYGILPAPPYFEDWVRGRNVDFKLPFDLWWLHKHDKLPGRDVIESWKYKRIKMNVYYDVKPPNVYEAQACLCAPPSDESLLGCGDNCINRVVYAECSPDLCPLKELCSNQRIQKHKPNDSKLVRFLTKDKGIGVRTEKAIKAGDYILEYVGEVVTDKEFKKRMTTLYKNDIHHYCLSLDGGLVIDSHRMGSDGRFVNHSCEPNCEIQKWNVNGLFRMALFAQRDIEPYEELTYDYNFALFNPEEGQPCYCGSRICRGVIGGKSQRVNGSSGGENSSNCSQAAVPNGSVISSKKSRLRPRKQDHRQNKGGHRNRGGDSDAGSGGENVLSRSKTSRLVHVEPLADTDKLSVQQARIFLIRNLSKVRNVREKLRQMLESKGSLKSSKLKQSVYFPKLLDVFASKEIFMKTRGIAQAEDNPEITKTLKLANLFRNIFNQVIAFKDEKLGKPFSELLMLLPRKDKEPLYYRRIEEPIDLNTIEMNISNGVYNDIASFDRDIYRVYHNTLKFYGRFSEHGISAVRVKRAYNAAKRQYISQIEEIAGQWVPSINKPPTEEEELKVDGVIRCICGLHNDEGTMILCERCFVWQHCNCVGANKDWEHYHCEKCVPREVNYEIALDVPPPKLPKPDEKHYLTLMRDDLLIRLSDTVYVLRDIPNPDTGTRHNFRTIKNFKYDDCDIFRIEQLWKTENGEKFAFGHHFLRPHETFHEPTRKFFPNEVLMILLYETVPLDLIMGRCHVMDAHTFSKGRPIDSNPDHIYICEWRVDSGAKNFYRLPKSKATSVSTKPHIFQVYDVPLKPKRDYAPHGEVKSVHAATHRNDKNSKKSKKATIEREPSVTISSSIEPRLTTGKMADDNLSQYRDQQVEKRKSRLDTILRKLLAKKATKSPLDVSYLLEIGKRNRKKVLYTASN